jgi:hypothetical protein
VPGNNGLDGVAGTPDDVAGIPAVRDDLTYKRFQAYLGMRVFW